MKRIIAWPVRKFHVEFTLSGALLRGLIITLNKILAIRDSNYVLMLENKEWLTVARKLSRKGNRSR